MRGIVLGDLEDESGELSADEPVSDLDIAHGALEATVVEAEEVPLAIDELPLVALLGCFAEGETVVRGAQELRVKESDRIAGVVEGLRGLGADIEATDDGFAVRGTGGLRGGVIDARGDHRMAMMGAVAGLASREGVEVRGDGGRRGLLSGVRGGSGGLLVRATSRARSDRRSRRRRASPRSRARSRSASVSPTWTAARCIAASRCSRSPRRRTRPAALAERAQHRAGRTRVLLDGRDVTDEIRAPEVSEAASRVAADPGVRTRWWPSSAR